MGRAAGPNWATLGGWSCGLRQVACYAKRASGVPRSSALPRPHRERSAQGGSMNITIAFRQMPASAALKKHVEEKAAKLQKFLRQPMSAKVTLSLDRLQHVAEVRISSGGQHLEAKEANEDMYVSVDKVIDKIERQIRGMKGTKESKTRRGGESLRASASASPADGTDGGPALARPRTLKVAMPAQSEQPLRPRLPAHSRHTSSRRGQAR